MKKIAFLIFFISLNIFGQVTKVITLFDAETNKAIPNARIVCDDRIFYTNDDGNAAIPAEAKNILITAVSYQGFRIEHPEEIMKLIPKYTDIQEVVIKNIDIKNVFKDVLKNYGKNYTTAPITYNIQIKQKAKEDNRLNNLFIADLKLWLLDSEYHYNNKLYSFAQMFLDNVKYYQTRRMEQNYIFDNDINIRPEQFIQKIFLNAELSGILNDSKKYKLSANIVSEDSIIQTIKFKSDKIEDIGIDFSGEVLLNKIDKAITYLKLNVNQSKTFSKKTNKRGEKYTAETTFSSITYEFYKNGEKYIPTRYELTGRGVHIYKSIESPFDFFQEIIYKSSELGNKIGLSNKLDLSKNLTDNIPTNEIKNSKTLLSIEEQKFVDEP